MQKVHVLLQPTEIDTQPLKAESRRVGSVEGNTSSDSRISTVVAGPVEQGGQTADVVRAEHDVDPGCPLDDGGPVLLGQAAADRDLQVRVAPLRGAELPEVAVELVVGVLAHGTGVEHDDIGHLGPVTRR
jgi:hypothetical protein